MSTPRSREASVVGGFVGYFRECLELGTPCEGDGDLVALWMIATRSPGVGEELLEAGIADLFAPDTMLPTNETFERARQWGTARFS